MPTLTLFVHDIGTQHILFVHRADVDAGHGNVDVGRRQGQQRFQ